MLHTFSGNSKTNKTAITSLLLITLLITPLLLTLNSLPVSAAENVLTAKWSRSSMGTNWEGGLVIGDVTGDGKEEIVYAGGGSDRINVLNGETGATIATYTNTRISQYCQPQLYDVNGDGVLDILVPLYSRPGLAVLRYTGSSTLSALWVKDTQGSSGSGSCMSKPVAGDINGDGHVEIYIACQDVSPAYNVNNATGQSIPIPDGYDGTVTMFDYQGNILAQNFNWRSCSGGLSLADTDNDGEFELYMGDRSMYYGDGNYGKGTIAYWARNLSIIWQRLDFLSSSQAPVLVDINGDGILDVLSGMYREMNIQNSSNGAIMQKWSGGSIGVMSVHYGFTVSDIDGDGHQELLCCDGDHDDDPYADVIDLVTGQLDAQLSLAGGDTKWSPIVADISPTQPGMEIICVPNGTTLETGYWRGAIMIYNSNFESLQNVTRFNGAALGSQLAFPMIQDIDSDGLLELVTHSSSGTIYAFDTQAPKPAQRIRSEVTYYSEKRTGVAQYVVPPWGENYWTAPIVAPVSPSNDALNVPITASQLIFSMREHQNQTVSYTVMSSPNIGSASGTSVSNSYNWANYTVNITPGSLSYDTTYTWTVTATDGTYTTTKTYMFHTALAPAQAGNSAPTQTTPTLTSTDGLNSTTSTFTAANQTTTDPNGDSVTNIYRWLVNNNPVANLQLPFDLRSATSTKDYAYGNNGIVKGATWVPNGIVGGAYSFDGQNDVIMISDGGKGYFDNKTYADNQGELGGGGNWTQMTAEAWINLREYNNGSRIIAKIPSYELGFYGTSASTLIATVWPKTGVINYNDDNHASSDKYQMVTAPVNLSLNTWYHIAFTYKSGEGLKLYLNGQMIAQKTGISGPLEDSYGEPVYIGRLVEPFNGLIDEVGIYQYAQSAQEIANSYQNAVNGLSSSASFIPFGVGDRGDTLSCQMIPTDSYSEGAMLSNSIIIRNAPPVASNLLTYPIRDRAYRLDAESLTANYTYYDADGDLESGSLIRWYMNGVLQSQYDNALQITSAATTVGQTWYFTVTPRDSYGDYGATVTSETITIRGNTLPTTNIPTLASVSGNIVTTAQGTTDADGDNTTNIYHWTKNGVSQTNLQMPFDTETPRLASSNPTAHDYSGYGNDGTVYGATWTKTGVVGGALVFDGNDYVRVQEHSGSLGGDGSWSKVSVEYWIKATGVTSAETVVMKHDTSYSTSTSASYGVGYRADFRSYANRDRFYWYIYNSTGSTSIEYSDMVTFGAWHHVVCTYESGIGLQLYVDGALRAATPFSGNINATLGGILDIGGVASGGTDFSGMLDEVIIYPTALSADQVSQRYNETKDGLTTNSTIISQAIDGWVCEVTPNDSWQDGTPKSTNGDQQFNLTINPSINGNTVPSAGIYSYDEDSNVQVQAVPSANYELDYWLRNGTQVYGNPYQLTMTDNYVLTAVFKEIPPQSDEIIYFKDDFESGNFSAWSSTTRTTSETTAIASNIVHVGSYSACLTSSGDGSYERAYASRSGLNLGEFYARAYVYVDQSGIVDNGDRFYFMQMMSGGNALAYAGWRRDSSGNLRWHIMVRDGTNTVGAYSTVSPAAGAWYLVELHWKSDSTSGLGELYIDGNLVASIINRNTANYGNLTIARYGLPEIYNCAPTTTYIDDVVISNQLKDTAPPEYAYLTVGNSSDGTTNPSVGEHEYEKGNQAIVSATANSGYTLTGWLLDGTPVAGTNPYILTMNDNHTLTPVFTLLPPPIYYNLMVEVSGNGVTNVTGTTSYLEGTDVPVLATANPNWQFDHWLLNGSNVGSSRTYTVNMNSNCNLTAVFTEQIQPPTHWLHIQTSGSGQVNASDSQYPEGTILSILATPDTNWNFAYWLINNTQTAGNPYALTIDGSYNVTAVFEAIPQPEYLFSDGFELGIVPWDTLSTTPTGEAVNFITAPVYAGNYAGSFSANGDTAYEKAYVGNNYLNPSLNTIYVQGVFSLAQNGIVENGDRIKLIELRANNTVIACAGIIERNGMLKWWLESRDGTSYVETYSSAATGDLSDWFTLELQWSNNAVNGGAILSVNGVQVVQVSGDNTGNYGNCTQIRIGLPEAYNCSSTTVLVDNVVFDTEYIP